MTDKVYIEKNALLDEFYSLCGPQTGDGWDNWGVESLICRQKPADVVPVVRGEWISWEEMFPDRQLVRKGLGVFCSVCKKHSDWPDEYCHRCGATMINSESYEDEEEVDIDDSDGEPDWCYECTGYGDDYSLNEDGELVHNCDSCKFNPLKDDEDE